MNKIVNPFLSGPQFPLSDHPSVLMHLPGNSCLPGPWLQPAQTEVQEAELATSPPQVPSDPAVEAALASHPRALWGLPGSLFVLSGDVAWYDYVGWGHVGESAQHPLPLTQTRSASRQTFQSDISNT